MSICLMGYLIFMRCQRGMSINRLKIVEKVKYTLRYRYRKGHRIHSPYVYRLVREVFMPKLSISVDDCTALTDMLVSQGVRQKSIQRISLFYRYNNFSSFVVNPTIYQGEDMVIFTSAASCVESFGELMGREDRRVALVLLDIYSTKRSKEVWLAIKGLKLDIYSFGIVVMDKYLNNEYYKLKI